jgi:1,3-beta-glucan synthase
LKQTKLRKRRVVRYAILYFILLVVFVALIAGPIVAGRFLTSLPSIPMELLQPTGLNHNDTSGSATGTAEAGAAATSVAARFRVRAY